MIISRYHDWYHRKIIRIISGRFYTGRISIVVEWGIFCRGMDEGRILKW